MKETDVVLRDLLRLENRMAEAALARGDKHAARIHRSNAWHYLSAMEPEA